MTTRVVPTPSSAFRTASRPRNPYPPQPPLRMQSRPHRAAFQGHCAAARGHRAACKGRGAYEKTPRHSALLPNLHPNPPCPCAPKCALSHAYPHPEKHLNPSPHNYFNNNHKVECAPNRYTVPLIGAATKLSLRESGSAPKNHRPFFIFIFPPIEQLNTSVPRPRAATENPIAGGGWTSGGANFSGRTT
jgi:hypothetical protein